MVRPKPIPRRNRIHAHARLQTLSHDPCFDLIGPPLLAIGPYLHPVVSEKLYRSRPRETPAQYPSETESQLRRKLGRCCPGNAYHSLWLKQNIRFVSRPCFCLARYNFRIPKTSSNTKGRQDVKNQSHELESCGTYSIRNRPKDWRANSKRQFRRTCSECCCKKLQP